MAALGGGPLPPSSSSTLPAAPAPSAQGVPAQAAPCQLGFHGAAASFLPAEARHFPQCRDTLAAPSPSLGSSWPVVGTVPGPNRVPMTAGPSLTLGAAAADASPILLAGAPNIAPATPVSLPQFDAAMRPPVADGSGCPPPVRVNAPLKSFAQAVLQTVSPSSSPLQLHAPASTDSGEPAAFFTPEEVTYSCRSLAFAVVARTPQGRPPFQDIRSHLAQRFKFRAAFLISSIDARHLLIRFVNKEDYLQVLLKESLYVHGRLFRFFKWSLEFSPQEDSPVVPVWLEMPGLPINFYHDAMLKSIAGSIGTVLQVDVNTSCMLRTHAACVCVQIDVSKKLPERVWVGVGGAGAWQPIIYPNPPQFCSSCRRLGHPTAKCKNNSDQPTLGGGGNAPGLARAQVNVPTPAAVKAKAQTQSNDLLTVKASAHGSKATSLAWRPTQLASGSNVHQTSHLSAPLAQATGVSGAISKGKVIIIDVDPSAGANLNASAAVAEGVQQAIISDPCVNQTPMGMMLAALPSNAPLAQAAGGPGAHSKGKEAIEASATSGENITVHASVDEDVRQDAFPDPCVSQIPMDDMLAGNAHPPVTSIGVTGQSDANVVQIACSDGCAGQIADNVISCDGGNTPMPRSMNAPLALLSGAPVTTQTQSIPDLVSIPAQGASGAGEVGRSVFCAGQPAPSSAPPAKGHVTFDAPLVNGVQIDTAYDPPMYQSSLDHNQFGSAQKSVIGQIACFDVIAPPMPSVAGPSSIPSPLNALPAMQYGAQAAPAHPAVAVVAPVLSNVAAAPLLGNLNVTHVMDQTACHVAYDGHFDDPDMSSAVGHHSLPSSSNAPTFTQVGVHEPIVPQLVPDLASTIAQGEAPTAAMQSTVLALPSAIVPPNPDSGTVEGHSEGAAPSSGGEQFACFTTDLQMLAIPGMEPTCLNGEDLVRLHTNFVGDFGRRPRNTYRRPERVKTRSVHRSSSGDPPSVER